MARSSGARSRRVNHLKEVHRSNQDQEISDSLEELLANPIFDRFRPSIPKPVALVDPEPYHGEEFALGPEAAWEEERVHAWQKHVHNLDKQGIRSIHNPHIPADFMPFTPSEVSVISEPEDVSFHRSVCSDREDRRRSLFASQNVGKQKRRKPKYTQKSKLRC